MPLHRTAAARDACLVVSNWLTGKADVRQGGQVPDGPNPASVAAQEGAALTCMSKYIGAPRSWMPFFSMNSPSAREG